MAQKRKAAARVEHTVQPKLFNVYHWIDNKTGWVHSSYRLARSQAHLLQLFPAYGDKHAWLIVEPARG